MARDSASSAWQHDDRFVDASDMIFAVPPDAVDRVVEVADMMAVFAAERLVAVAEVVRDAFARERFAGRVVSAGVMERSVRLEIAAALRVTEYVAGELLALADALVHRYPVVLDALHRAEITEQHAQILVSAVDGVEPEHRSAVLARGLVLAVELPVGSFRRALRRLVDTVRVQSLAQRHQDAVRSRRVVVEDAGDGMSWMHALIPSVEAHAIHGRLTGIAKTIRGRDGDVSRTGDPRTLDQVRADVLCDLLIDGHAPVHPDVARGIRASVVVTVPVLTLLGGGGEPASVEGVGPIPVERARELCGGAERWMRVLTHPETGMVLSVGRDRYSPPPELRKLVTWRAERCMAPGCGCPRHGVRLTTRSRGSTADRPPWAIMRRCARGTTRSSTTATGRYATSRAAAARSNGPHPPGQDTSSHPNDQYPYSDPRTTSTPKRRSERKA